MATSAPNLAVSVVGLSKSYRIGHLERAYTMRETVQNFIASPVTRLRAAFRAPTEEETIWALRDVSFDVNRGEVVGIIGRNGAGKSTLLKILSRITDPAEGYADVWGRLSSLLEIGTGFHAELTGRDNVFLNGAILGMSRRETASKFDQIVEFSGVEKFIDTPVKRYSSGMYMRLAFAVAAHLDPDILVVDEVLAVGDAEFQKKSLGKMREVSGEGRTVLFVSHNMASIRALCDRAILLQDGRVIADGPVDPVVTRYLGDAVKAEPQGRISPAVSRVGTGDARLTHIELQDRGGAPLSRLFLGQPTTVVLRAEVQSTISDGVFEVGVSSLDGVRVATSFSTDGNRPAYPLEPGLVEVSLDLDLTLLPGHYTLDVGLHHTGVGWTIDFIERILDFEVLNTAESGGDAYPTTAVRGFVRPEGQWHAPREAGAARDPVRLA
jgi:lipopolysaccharide transport system ATP-binding protein